MPDVEKEIAITARVNDQTSAGLGSAQANMQSSTAAMQRMGSQARTTGIALTAIGVGGMMATRNIVSGAQDTEQAYARVNTMLGQGEDALKDYGTAIKSLTREIPIQGGEVAALDGMYQVLSAGIERGADATMVLEAAMKAAVGGMTTTEQSVDILTTALNAYGLEGEKATLVTDQLSKVVQLGKTTYDELAGALGPVLAIAAQLGVNLEQVGASMATLTKAGISTDIAATALRATLVSFLNPTKEMGDAIEEVGFASGSAMLEAEGLQGSLELLSNATGGSKEAMVELFPNVRALTAILPLTGEMAGVAAEDLEAMGQAAGTAASMFGDMADTTESQFTILSNRIQQAKDAIAQGATPAMLRMKETQARLLEGTAKLNEETSGMVGVYLAVGSSILTTVGPMVAIYGQYLLMKANKLQIAALTKMETAAVNQHTAALGANSTALTTNTAASMGNAKASGIGARAMGGLKGALSSTMGMAGLATGAIMGVGLAVGALVDMYYDAKEAQAEATKAAMEHVDALKEENEALGEQYEILVEAAEGNVTLTNEVRLLTIEMRMLSGETERGTAAAVDLREEWIKDQEALLKGAEAADKWYNWMIKGSDAAMDSKEAIKDRADELFGAIMTEAEAIEYLVDQYDFAAEHAENYITWVDTLTVAQIDAEIAAGEQAYALDRLREAEALAATEADFMTSVIDKTTDELIEMRDATEAEMEATFELAYAHQFTDSALMDSLAKKGIALGDEFNLINEMITLKENDIAVMEEEADAYDELTDSIVGTETATTSLAEALRDMEFSPDLETQLTILDRKMEGVIDRWVDLFGGEDEETMDRWGTRLSDEMEYQLSRVTNLIAEGKTGEEIMNLLVQGLEASGIQVSDALFNMLREYVSAYLELHSPAKAGPLHNLDTYWVDFVPTLMKGFDKGAKKGGGIQRGVTDIAAGAPAMAAGGAVAPAGPRIHIDNVNITGYGAGDGRKMARDFMEEMEELMIS